MSPPLQHRLQLLLISDAEVSLRRLNGASGSLGIIPERVTDVIDQHGRLRLVYSALFAAAEHVRQALATLGTAAQEG